METPSIKNREKWQKSTIKAAMKPCGDPGRKMQGWMVADKMKMQKTVWPGWSCRFLYMKRSGWEEGVVCSKRLLDQAAGKSLRTHTLKSGKGAYAVPDLPAVNPLRSNLSEIRLPDSMPKWSASAIWAVFITLMLPSSLWAAIIKNSCYIHRMDVGFLGTVRRNDTLG